MVLIFVDIFYCKTIVSLEYLMNKRQVVLIHFFLVKDSLNIHWILRAERGIAHLSTVLRWYWMEYNIELKKDLGFTFKQPSTDCVKNVSIHTFPGSDSEKKNMFII